MEQHTEKIYRRIVEETDRDRIWSDIQALNQWYRYTGTQAGEQAAAYIRRQLTSCGVPVEWVQYPCYRSLPGEAYLELPGSEGRIPLTPYVYSGTAERLEGEIIFDVDSLRTDFPQKDMAARLARLSGKLVLTYDSYLCNCCEPGWRNGDPAHMDSGFGPSWQYRRRVGFPRDRRPPPLPQPALC